MFICTELSSILVAAFIRHQYSCRWTVASTITKRSLYSPGGSVFTNEGLHYNVPVRNFEWIFELSRGDISSLVAVSAVMDIILGVVSELVFKTFPDHKFNVMSIENSPTNNNLFFIGHIDFNASFFYIFSENISIIM